VQGVPGTPSRQPGEMHYSVRRHPGGDGPLLGSVTVVTELADQRSALTVQVGRPHTEMPHTLTPEPEGTRSS
jgi:hypothetical protein